MKKKWFLLIIPIVLVLGFGSLNTGSSPLIPAANKSITPENSGSLEVKPVNPLGHSPGSGSFSNAVSPQVSAVAPNTSVVQGASGPQATDNTQNPVNGSTTPEPVQQDLPPDVTPLPIVSPDPKPDPIDPVITPVCGGCGYINGQLSNNHLDCPMYCTL